MKLINKIKNLTVAEMFYPVFVAVAITVSVSFLFFVQNVKVVGESMDSTLANGDLLIASRSNKDIQRGDIVVVDSTVLNEAIIKRVIAIAGDEFTFRDNVVFVNGKKIDEPYINEKMVGNPDFTITIPEGTVWVMGDNRNHSGDSRFIGAVPIEEVSGEVMARFFPFSNVVAAEELN